jgi:hypothetical protein
VLFANHTICEQYKSHFNTSILDHLKSRDDLNRAQLPYWRDDLKDWLRCIAAEEQVARTVGSSEEPSMCQPFKVSESFLRKWLKRSSVSNSISKLADRLLKQSPLSGQETVRLVMPLLNANDFVGEEDIEKNA